MAWYTTGTVSVAQNSKTVTGIGTKWADNKMAVGAGQALLVPGHGSVQMYEIASVDSDTKITLVDAWSAASVSNSAYAVMTFYSDSRPDFARRLAVQLAYYQSQMDGWQQIMTGTGSVTLEAPDGTMVTISSFQKLTTDMAGKADKTDLDKKVDKTSLGNSASRDVGFAAGTVAAGDDGRLNTVGGKSGGQLLGGLGVLNGTAGIDLRKAGTYLLWNEQLGTGISSLVNNPESGGGGFWIRLINSANTVERARFTFSPDSTMTVPQGVYTVNGRVRAFTAVGPTYLEVVVDGSPKGINFFDSDERLKEDIEDVKLGEASGVIKNVRPVSYKFKDTELIKGATHQFGVIAQELEAVLPTAVITLSNGNKALDPLELFGLLLTSNKEMLERIERLEEDIKTLKEK